MHGGLQGGRPAVPAQETAEPANGGVHGARHVRCMCTAACATCMACARRVHGMCAWHVHGVCMACVPGMCTACARHVCTACAVDALGRQAARGVRYIFGQAARASDLSHRSSASSHALKQTTVQAYASPRSPAAARMTATACVAPPFSRVGPIARAPAWRRQTEYWLKTSTHLYDATTATHYVQTDRERARATCGPTGEMGKERIKGVGTGGSCATTYLPPSPPSVLSWVRRTCLHNAHIDSTC